MTATTAVVGFTGETEFTRVEVWLDEQGPDEWPLIDVVLNPVYGDGTPDDERTIQLSMDEARQVIAGLAAVVR